MQDGEHDGEYVEVPDMALGEEGSNSHKKPLFVRIFVDFIDSKYVWICICFLLICTSFILGRLSALSEKRPPVRVLSSASMPQVAGVAAVHSSVSSDTSSESSSTQEVSSEQVVASKNGTKYHYPWCGGAKQISEKNKIVFSSIEEARAAGYTPAGNCKGLK